ncbi:class B sortase [Virgibacillus dokdonensis]|uniref:Class B sortase n=1 Tax=Virgibacillus dokdonensis TaxID=302167 RepID=A0A2K9IX08_9BACI|nr:class B sortase [Virgibacillus dokdonensis]AUJ24289.1 Sortase family protein [Virgibacillus dokdonensis]
MSGKKIRKSLSNLLITICLGVFVYSAYELVSLGLDYYQNRQVLADVQDIYAAQTKASDSSEVEKGEIRKQFKELHKINPDIIGWLAIDKTNINYPILQAENNEHYLYRNYKEEQSRAGSIFMDYRNNVNAYNSNIVLYGHNMKDGSMFHNLRKYTDEEFFSNHRSVYFDTKYESYQAEVFSVYHTTTDFDYIQTHFSTQDEYRQLVNEIKDKSVFQSDVHVNEKDTIITLSTCDYTLDPDEGRFVVHAKISDQE